MATLFYIEGRDGQEDFDLFSTSKDSGKLSWNSIADEEFGLEFDDPDDPDVFDENDKQFNVRPPMYYSCKFTNNRIRFAFVTP